MRPATAAAAAVLAAALTGPAMAGEAAVHALAAERSGDGGARFLGRTALADGTRLRLVVTHPDSGYRDWSGELVVADGAFASATFHDHGFPLPAGRYRVTVMGPGDGAGPEPLSRARVRLGPMSRTGRAVALLGGTDFSADCPYPTAPFRANFEHFFYSGYGLRVESWRLVTGADDVERLRLVYSFAGKGRTEAIWEVDLAARTITHANTEARRLSCY